MRPGLILLTCAVAGACARGPAPASAPSPRVITHSGTASWYGPGFHGKPTTSGELYDQNAFTAAHRTFPLGTRVRVTNVKNEKSIEVRINDRGPFVGDRIIDLSFAAATVLGMIGPGTAEVLVEVLASPVALSGVPTTVRYAVQVGSYSNRETAEAARARVSRSARDVTVVTTRAGSQILHRVRLGDFADINAAKDEAARLRREGIDAIVVER